MTTKQKTIGTILIVDDKRENVDLLDAILSPEYTIIRSSRGAETLAIVRQTPPDLILLDVMMPEMDGYDVCRCLKADETTKRIPVIFVTALLDPGDEMRGFEAGGVDYITKPVIGAVVRTRVKAQLALKTSQDEMELWNNNLKRRLLKSIANMRLKTEAYMSAEEKWAGARGCMQSVELFSRVFEQMEDQLGISSWVVSALAGDAALKMRLPVEEVAMIRLAGLLHDIGLLGIGRGVSGVRGIKQGDIYTHPARGQELFTSLDEYLDVGLMVRSHHEAYNGSGYPDGLRGDDIPLGARLIAIADVIEQAANSVTVERDEYALTSVRRHAGTLLDPKLVSYFRMITRVLYFEEKNSATAAAG